MLERRRVTGNHPARVIAAHPIRWERPATLVLALTANSAATFLGLFAAQALGWATVSALGIAATGAAGALASQGKIHLWAVLVVGTAGAEVGGVAGCWMGHRVAHAGVERGGRFNERRKKALDSGARMEKKWGPLVVFFVPSWVSGALGMRMRQFAVWNVLSAALWTTGAALGSYGVASAISSKSAEHILVPLIIGLAALAAIVAIMRTRRRRQDADRGPLAPGA